MNREEKERLERRRRMLAAGTGRSPANPAAVSKQQPETGTPSAGAQRTQHPAAQGARRSCGTGGNAAAHQPYSAPPPAPQAHCPLFWWC